jgi:hypothetical protein
MYISITQYFRKIFYTEEFKNMFSGVSTRFQL